MLRRLKVKRVSVLVQENIDECNGELACKEKELGLIEKKLENVIVSFN